MSIKKLALGAAIVASTLTEGCRPPLPDYLNNDLPSSIRTLKSDLFQLQRAIDNFTNLQLELEKRYIKINLGYSSRDLESAHKAYLETRRILDRLKEELEHIRMRCDCFRDNLDARAWPKEGETFTSTPAMLNDFAKQYLTEEEVLFIETCNESFVGRKLLLDIWEGDYESWPEEVRLGPQPSTPTPAE